MPDWWTPEIEAETIEYAKSVLRRVVLVTGVIDELRDDVYALAGNVVVRNLFSSVHEIGVVSVGLMWGRPASTECGVAQCPRNVGGRPVSTKCGVVQRPRNVGSSSVHEMWGRPASTKCGVVQRPRNVESSSVGLMRESSSVHEMWGRPASA